MIRNHTSCRSRRAGNSCERCLVSSWCCKTHSCRHGISSQSHSDLDSDSDSHSIVLLSISVVLFLSINILPDVSFGFHAPPLFSLSLSLSLSFSDFFLPFLFFTYKPLSYLFRSFRRIRSIVITSIDRSCLARMILIFPKSKWRSAN